MTTNEKMANEIIEELEAEKTELLKTLEAANDLIEADSKMHAKYVEKSVEIIKLAKENQRLLAENVRMCGLLDNWLTYCGMLAQNLPSGVYKESVMFARKIGG